MSQRYIGGLIYNPPGGFSGYFDGNGDYLSLASNAAFAMGTGDFTVEGFLYLPTTQNFGTLFLSSTTGSGDSLHVQISNANRVRVTNASTEFLLGTNAIPLNTWTHVAVVRSGTTLSIYQNGVLNGSTTNSTNFIQSGALVGLEPFGGSFYFTGYISNVRVLKGTALYTSAFTPPSGPLQAITNTSLLTCAYPTFRDGSSNNFTITVNGNTAVSVQNPFPLTALPNPNLGNQGNGVYTMSQYQSLRSQNLWPAIDPYWEYVTLMLHGNGTNGAQNNTFLDSSTNNFTITRNGNTTQGAFSPYGEVGLWSNYTAGSASGASRIDVASTSGLFGTNVSYTIEGWFNYTANTSGDNQNIVATNTNTFPSRWTFDVGITGGTIQPRLVTESNGVVFNSTAVPYTLGTWVHIALVNNDAANTCTFYVNGVAVGTRAKVSLTAYSTLNLLCNISAASPAPFYVSNLRIVNNVAVYTSNFTPSTSPLTAITGTGLLTFQNNRFIDNSSSARTLTVNGTNQIQRFSPFHPTAPYAAGTIGGSGYFDGSGDYLTAPNNTALDLSTGDFTVEVWFYPTQANQSGTIVNRHNGNYATGNDFQYSIYMSSGSLIVRPYQGTTDYTTNVGTPQRNAWNHAALVRTGNTFYGFLNGVRGATSQTISGALNNSTWATYLGAALSASIGNDFFTGYMGAVRITKGGALYTAATYTVPTAPLTTTVSSGTVSLLTNFTNGGIIDNAMMNDLETVGNAQISTSVSKFGGGSMYFDGTGDWLKAGVGRIADFGTGDFTIEAWVYLIAYNASQSTIFSGGQDFNVTNQPNMNVNTDGTVNLSGSQGTSNTVSLNTWTHIAISRSSGTSRIFINGVQGSSASNTTNYNGVGCFVGVRVGSGITYGDVNGYIDDLRITRGFARYTANFTPQRSQWQDQ